jgi:hypothetical protein
MDCIEGVPQRATLPEQQLFTTYGNLKQIIQQEIDRLVHGRVEFHSNHTLEVCNSKCYGYAMFVAGAYHQLL